MGSELLQLHRVTATDYRCFAGLDLRLEPDLTVIFAENGGGKTLALRAIAALLGGWLPRLPAGLWTAGRARPDLRWVRTPAGAWEPVGPAVLRASGVAGGVFASWELRLGPDDQKVSRRGLAGLQPARRRVLVPRAPWPVVAWYGTQRLWAQMRATPRRRAARVEREDGYLDCLDPRASEDATLEWLHRECVGDGLARLEGRPVRGFGDAVLAAMARATPGVRGLSFDFARGEVIADLHRSGSVPWGQLSDGYHVFLGLIGDIARRAVALNDHLGPGAVEAAEGVVLIDEVDLHLHPAWQEQVLAGLRRAFPRLQLVVSTHSPLVLSSAENRQVRALDGFAVVERAHYVQGRDVGSIYREEQGAHERAAWGRAALADLRGAIDAGDEAAARAQLERLAEVWGPSDPELAYAEALLGPGPLGGEGAAAREDWPEDALPADGSR
jgi:hypothetical protein